MVLRDKWEFTGEKMPYEKVPLLLPFTNDEIAV